MDEIKVSILCAAYNHENYIRQTLEGFINQKTDFSFEVLINDDCSTDNTKFIIMEFEEKYPDIIKPTYQEENQYSKGLSIVDTFLLPRAKGKYIAFCEGDDHWIDNNKLQMQYDYMEEHTECYLYATGCKVNDLKNNTQYDRIVSDCACDFTFEEVIDRDITFNTCTYFMRREAITEMPNCFYVPGVSDIQMAYFAGILGRIHYDPIVTGMYNYFVPGSWSQRFVEKGELRNKNWIKMLQNVNEYYNFQYDKLINKSIRKSECEILLLHKEYSKIWQEYKDIYKTFDKNKKLKILIGKCCPKLLDKILEIKRESVK